MSKILALFALAIAAALIHLSISTTDANNNQCGSPVSMQQLTHCLMHLTEKQGKLRMAVEKVEQQHLQQCCKQLSLVQHKCQCDAIQEVFDQAREQGGRKKVVEKLVRAARLPDDCGLKVRQCPIVIPRDD